MNESLLNLVVGADLELDSSSNVVLNNLKSELIGYTNGHSLIISHPDKDGIPVQVNPGERFIANIKQGDEDICFEIEVTTVLTEPYPHLHTSYPENVRSGSLRKSSRVPAAPADVHLVIDGDIDNTSISIINVSTAGACLIADSKLGLVDDMFQINFQTSDSAPGFTFTCMIRHVHETHVDQQPMFSHGVLFIGMDAEAQLFLWKYFQKSALTQEKTS